MDEALQELYKYALNLQDYLLIKNADAIDNIVDSYLDKIDKCVTNTISTLQINININKDEYIRKHLKEFLLIFQVLIGSISKERLKQYKNKSLLRSVADKIFIKLLKIRKISVYMYRFPSLIFTEFCKGITYFDTEMIVELDKLIYHRNQSCGASDRDYLNKFQKGSNDTETKQIQNINALRKCYIERSIFNFIYMKFSYQDIGHLLELKHIERLLEEYYPKQSITIVITEYDHGIYPKTLKLIYSSMIHGMNIEIIETYRKIRDPISQEYLPETVCYKTLSKQKNGKSIIKTYSKKQTFIQEMKWIN